MDGTCCYCFLTPVVSYGMMFLFQSWLWDGPILRHGFIITINISWTINKNTKHLQLIPQTFNHFHCCLRWTKLSAERTCFDYSLWLTIPMYQYLIDEDKDIRLTLSIFEVPTMVHVHKTCYYDTMYPRFRHVWSYCIFCIPIEIEKIFT